MHCNWCITAICSTAMSCYSIALGNSLSADRCGMAASRFLAAVGACVILLCFAAESRKSYGSGSMKVANGALAAILFFILVLMIPDDFPFLIPF